MTITPSDQSRLPPGERLKQQLWLRALSVGGPLPTPTLERIKAVKALASTWAEEDEE